MKADQEQSSRKTSWAVSLVVLTVAVLIGVNIYFVQKLSKDNLQMRYWTIHGYNKSHQKADLDTVDRVLDRLGQKKVNGSYEEWDILWSWMYPFDILDEYLKDVRPHQLINHFPGINFLTSKM
jgi:hypothetical protein